jgi:hypothetical protein
VTITAANKKFGQNAGLTLRNINFCFAIVLQLLGATELYSTKNFILNFK